VTVSITESAAAVLAIAYLVLAIRQNIWCWLAAFVSSVMFIAVFVEAKLYMQAVLNGFYGAMAIYGWYEWRAGGAGHEGVRINVWSASRHLAAIAVIVAASIAFAAGLEATDAAHPYLDSLTSVGAVVTTFMVARKVLENWFYWLVIDALTLYLYAESALYVTAALYGVYLVLVVVGFRQWLGDYRAERHA
jgi:nicotinamide mononucleotide transporter